LIRTHNAPLHANAESPEQTIDADLPNSFSERNDERMDCHDNSADLSSEAKEANQSTLSPDNFDESISKHVDILIAKLYNKPGYPRNLVDSLCEDLTEFLSGDFLQILQNMCVQNLDSDTPDDVRLKLSKMFEAISNPFKLLSTEYRRFKHFQSLGTFIPPISYVIDTRMERVNGRPEMKDVTGQFIPPRKVLKKFLELPDVFNAIVAFVRKLESDDSVLENFVQGEVWKWKWSRYEPDDIVLPLALDFDDFEPNNALGPHCESLGAVYLCLPTYLQSRLENIFLALLFNADDRKLYGNYRTFKPLLEELKYLETQGIVVNLPEGQKKVYYVTGAIMGDNKGLN